MARKSRRKIEIIGEIDYAAFLKFSRKMSRLEKQSCAQIDIELTSDGGDALAALAFSDRITSSPCIVHITAFGAVQSAAVIILASGDHRMMGGLAWVMVHEDSGKVTGSVTEMEKQIARFRDLENQWNVQLSNLTHTSEEKWAELHKATTYLSAEECFDLGLIDALV